MKVLRIYDHLGKLKKEFNVYVEGEDFKWQASVPEVLWLGTIVLEESTTPPQLPPEPNLVVLALPPIVSPEETEKTLEKEPEGILEELKVAPEEVEEQKQLEADARREEQKIEEMEVKNEPKTVRPKCVRAKGTSTPGKA